MTELQPSIVVLKTGEKLITILQEAFEGEGESRKGICLVMNYPYELELINTPSPEETVSDLQVKFSKWCPYAIDSQYRIPYDGILTVGIPDPGLTTAYKAKVDATVQMEARKAAEAELAEESQEEPAIDPEVV